MKIIIYAFTYLMFTSLANAAETSPYAQELQAVSNARVLVNEVNNEMKETDEYLDEEELSPEARAHNELYGYHDESEDKD